MQRRAAFEACRAALPQAPKVERAMTSPQTAQTPDTADSDQHEPREHETHEAGSANELSGQIDKLLSALADGDLEAALRLDAELLAAEQRLGTRINDPNDRVRYACARELLAASPALTQKFSAALARALLLFTSGSTLAQAGAELRALADASPEVAAATRQELAAVAPSLWALFTLDLHSNGVTDDSLREERDLSGHRSTWVLLAILMGLAGICLFSSPLVQGTRRRTHHAARDAGHTHTLSRREYRILDRADEVLVSRCRPSRPEFCQQLQQLANHLRSHDCDKIAADLDSVRRLGDATTALAPNARATVTEAVSLLCHEIVRGEPAPVPDGAGVGLDEMRDSMAE